MLGTKPGDCYYWKNDEYMYFTFDGIHSSLYHLFIVNNNELTIENTIGAQSSFSNAMQQDGTYYLGTSATQKQFKRTCASEGLTLEQYKEMIQWLTPGRRGTLILDSNPFWGWDVVVDTVGDAKMQGSNNFLIVQFDVTFKTINTYLAHNIFPTIWETINYDSSETEDDIIKSITSANSYRIPSLLVKTSSSDDVQYLDLYIQSICNKKQEFDIVLDLQSSNDEVSGKTNIKLNNAYSPIQNSNSENSNSDLVLNVEYLETQFKVNEKSITISYASNTGLVLYNSVLAERSGKCELNRERNGLIKIEAKSPRLFKPVSIDNSGTDTIITLTEKDYNDFILTEGEYVAAVNKNKVGTKYGSAYQLNEEGDNSYVIDNDSYIAFNFGFVDNNVPKFEINDAAHTITFIGQKFESTNYYIYRGISNKFTFRIESDALKLVDASVILKSYNNM